MTKVNIYEYTDFRKYLKDVFKEHRKLHDSFSHRYVASKLSLSTSNFIWLVMQGKRKLNQTHCFKLSEIFKHSPRESDYFENMVNFSQAKTHREKDRFFSKMILTRKGSPAGMIEERHFAYLSNWYNAVIRELVTHGDFKKDFSNLAKRLRPQITESQAKKSFELLTELGLIKEKNGRFVQSTPILSTGPEVSSLAAMNFHRAMGRIAIESLDSLGETQRNISACVVSLSKESYKKSAEAIADCRSRILAIAESENKPDTVFTINFQCFPVSSDSKKE